MLKDKVIKRAYNLELRANNDEKHGNFIEGLPIVYESKTDLGYFDEIIERGALDSCDLRDVKFLVNHDTSKIPLARSRNNNENSTMQMKITDDGLRIRVDLDTENNTEARNLYSAVSRGDIDSMSFMFEIESDEWEGLDTEHPTRRIRSIKKVYEVSAVTFPAYEDTELSARDKTALESAKKTLDSVKNRTLDSEKAELELLKAKIRNY